MKSRRDREREERRRYILNKAQALFAEKGYLSTSMAEIAQESEFAVGSLYSFFSSKEEILATIFHEHIENLLSKNESIKNDPELNGKEKVEASLDALVRVYVENQDFFRIYVAEARGVEWGVRTEVGEYIYNGSLRYLNALSQIIKQAMDEGFVDPTLDPEYVALLLRSFVHSTASHFLYGNRNISVEQILDMGKRILFNGIKPIDESR